MSTPNPQDQDRQQPQQIFVRADEIDAGTSILTPSKELPLSALTPADIALSGTARPKPPARPGLKRDGSGAPPPPPPSQPPPSPPPQADPTDSLSLPQLRQLVSQFPKTEQRAYAFQYADAEDFAHEIDEWFHYTELEQDRGYLLTSLEAFEQRWRLYCESNELPEDTTWIAVTDRHREQFCAELVDDVSDDDYASRIETLCCIYYVLMGAWSTTAGLEPQADNAAGADDPASEHTRVNAVQIQWMHKGVDVLTQKKVISSLFDCLMQAAEPPVVKEPSPNKEAAEASEGDFGENEYREIILCLSCFYILVESARSRIDTERGVECQQAFLSLQSSFLVFLVKMISRLRWDESYNIPLMHALQLFWKSILLFFGDSKDHLARIKGILQPKDDPFSSEAAHPILTASPLDYHLFRQEITSKYPAYNPPLPLVPLELEHKTMLPPLSSNNARSDGYSASITPGGVGSASRGSILHQPVHIATPAPSPPPSPAGPGGKTGKKQNYQTNQNFPFLYPPLDSSSNAIGGKGSTQFQDLMVGRQWEGSDVPRSIIEAGELFASRMRMTRGMRQLWKERDLFMKYERGWKGSLVDLAQRPGAENTTAEEQDELDSLNDDILRSRMAAVDDFFRQALPDLQSLVIVMMKVMLNNVQDVAVRNGGLQDTSQASGLNRSKSNSNIAQNQSLPMPPPPPLPADMILEDLDNVRWREISQKAVSGAIFLLLKWFKVSHVLKFEYLTQLLLDSNYVQLTLKFFAHQNLEDLVAFRYDRDDLSVWQYCHAHSDHPPLSPTSPDEHSDSSAAEDAAPPPISRHRQSPSIRSDAPPSPEQTQSQQASNNQEQPRPSVDELGNPLGPLPTTPIEEFSFRQFQTSIHLLRILQKLTRGKSHRILFLVQFKSSQILRRILRVPDPTLRLYVLKLFKSQVPYCGRKWRQSNMRVITAIYLHCRPELRDEWLAGMHDANVEGEVDEAVPLEWALRGLTFWWQKRMYPGVMRRTPAKSIKGHPTALDDTEAHDEVDHDDVEASKEHGHTSTVEDEGGQEIDPEERDFFQRELDALGWGLANLQLATDADGIAFGEEAASHAAAMSATTNNFHYPQQQHQLPSNGITTNANNNSYGVNGAMNSTTANIGSNSSGPHTTSPLPAPTPQWVVADAANIEAWQNG